MSLKKLNDGWEKQFIGYTFSERLKQRLMDEHIKRVRREVDHRIFESVVVSVLDPRRQIKGIGLSMPQDLILDNFGNFLAALIMVPAGADKTVTLKDDANTDRVVGVRASTTVGNLFSWSPGYAVGTRLRVGSGTTPAARTNYGIQTPFTVSPENTYFSSGEGSYAAGAISFSASITAGGSGTVNETGFFFYTHTYTAWPQFNYMMFHDILATGVSFSAGQIITVSYSISI